MSEGLEKLQQIGAQKIHEDTHIALKYVQAILHESFEGMQRVQLLGFISILEREYHIQLTQLRQNANDFFDEMEQSLPKEEPSYKKELLVSQKPNRSIYFIIGFIIIIALTIFVYFMTKSVDKPKEHKIEQQHKQPISPQPVVEHNSSQIKQIDFTSKRVEKKSFTIIPKSKVWVGIIELPEGKKRQEITTDPIELNASKEYLLTFGHGYIDFNLNGKLQTFKDPQSIKFLYENGVLRQIDTEEFKARNKGRLW